MDEQLARHQADDLVGRHPAVGAADPQVARRLLRRERPEELGIALADAPGPPTVVDEQMRKIAHVLGPHLTGFVGQPLVTAPPARLGLRPRTTRRHDDNDVESLFDGLRPLAAPRFARCRSEGRADHKPRVFAGRRLVIRSALTPATPAVAGVAASSEAVDIPCSSQRTTSRLMVEAPRPGHNVVVVVSSCRRRAEGPPPEAP